MKKIFLSLMLLAAMAAAHAQRADMARGADLSWTTEMEAGGRTFLDRQGQVADLFAVMKEFGLTAVRLRVWVNPTSAYGAWCDKADVLAKARRAKAQGLDLMIDFHYSDIFADPGTQTAPADWAGYSLEQVKAAVAQHTRDVLQALKDEGIEPRWVQVGNETNQGMVWDYGKIDWTKSGSSRFAAYAELSNVGYDAVKAVLPQALVIVHLSNAYNAADSDCWFFKDFKAAGGKFDAIGLSHYPDAGKWDSTTAGDQSNANAAKSVKTLAQKFGVPVLIVETGFNHYDVVKADQAMRDLMARLEAIDQCAGVFYWEPEVDGQWMPGYYATKGWAAYGMGAFTSYGRPTIALDAFGAQGSKTEAHKPARLLLYDTDGKQVLATLALTAPGATTYRGVLNAATPWLNFFVVNQESNTWYGTDPADKTQLSDADGKWNCWIDSEVTGNYAVEVDLATMKWTHTLYSDGISTVGSATSPASSCHYDLLGRTAADSQHGIVVEKRGAVARKVIR